MDNLPGVKGSTEHRKGKREKTDTFRLTDLTEPGISSSGRFRPSKKGKDLNRKNSVNLGPGGRGRKGRKDFGKGPKVGQKRKMEKSPVTKDGWAGDVSSSGSKLRKQKKVGKT